MNRLSAIGLVACTVLVSGCGGAKVDSTATLAQLRTAIATPVDSQAKSSEHSHLVEQVVEESMLQNKRRSDVEQTLGKGSECSKHPKCAELGFQDDDWFYDIGVATPSNAPVPELIVGFDHFGRVERTWNLRTHE